MRREGLVDCWAGLCFAFAAYSPALAANQVATGQGQCSVAINASGQAQVVVNNYCDAKTAATLRRLIDDAAKANEKNRQQDQRLQRLEADREAQARQFKELVAAVQTVNQKAEAPAAAPADKQAATLLAEGDTSGAIALLGREAAAAGNSAAASNRRSADLYQQQAALLRLQNVQDALKALELALLAEPEDFSTLWDAGDLALAAGKTESAKGYYNRMAEVASRALAADTASAEWQRDLFVSYSKIGNVQAAQGDTAAALKSHQSGLAITERLAAADPRNTQWQHNLSMSYNRIGEVQAAQGDTAAALKSHQSGLAIAERLAAAAPATPSGSATSSSATARSVTCRPSRATSPLRSRAISPAWPSPSAWPPPTAATPSGSATSRYLVGNGRV